MDTATQKKLPEFPNCKPSNMDSATIKKLRNYDLILFSILIMVCIVSGVFGFRLGYINGKQAGDEKWRPVVVALQNESLKH